MIVCNARNLGDTFTGVQRYTSEILKHFPEAVEVIRPDRPLHGVSGHLWEQLVLPGKLKGRLLWSPSNSGPLAVRKQVVTVLDMVPLDHPESMSWKYARWYQFLLPRLIEQVRMVLTISEFSRSRILHHCPGAADKLHVVPLAADDRFMRADEVAIAEMRRALAIPTPHFLVALGSLEPRKNLARLVRAWARVSDRLPDDVWLVLAGAKGKSLVFRDAGLDHLPPRVHLTGYVPDAMLPALYSGALASVYISLYEGFGMPPLEALACGTPTLTSNTTSLPEVVADAALTVDPRDDEAIEAAIQSLVEDSSLRDRLSRLGPQRASTFSWKRNAEDTWRLLTEAAQLGEWRSSRID